jgi:hypothetical protein
MQSFHRSFHHLSNLRQTVVKVKAKVTLRLTGQPVSQSVCLGVEPTLGFATRYHFLFEGCYLKCTVLSLRGDLSDEKTGLQLAGQSLNGPSRAERVTILCCLIGGPCSLIHIPQEQGGPVILPGTGFPLRHLLWLAGLRWRYSNPPPHGLLTVRLSLHAYAQSMIYLTWKRERVRIYQK